MAGMLEKLEEPSVPGAELPREKVVKDDTRLDRGKSFKCTCVVS